MSFTVDFSSIRTVRVHKEQLLIDGSGLFSYGEEYLIEKNKIF